MATTTQERSTRMPRNGALLYGFVIGALAWKLQLMTNYSLVPFACWRELSILIHLASLSTLLLTLSGAWVSWNSWRQTGEGFETELGGEMGRSRFLALAGLALNGFFALLILGQWLPNLLLSPCDGIS